MSKLVERLLNPAERDRMLNDLEAEMRRSPVLAECPEQPVTMQRQVFRVDAIRAVMVQAILDHGASLAAPRQALAQLTDLVNERLLRLRDEIAGQLTGEQRVETEEQSARMVTLQMIAEYVDALSTRTSMSVAEIDAELADVLAPPPFDWGDVKPAAEATLHKATYELLKLRNAAVHRENMQIPDLAERMSQNNRAIEALAVTCVSREACEQIVYAIRHGDIPHVSFVD